MVCANALVKAALEARSGSLFAESALEGEPRFANARDIADNLLPSDLVLLEERLGGKHGTYPVHFLPVVGVQNLFMFWFIGTEYALFNSQNNGIASILLGGYEPIREAF